MILSPWKLTFDPSGTAVVLLDYGQRLEGDVSWASRRGAEVISLVDSPLPFLRDGKNVSLQIGFRKIINSATSAAMLSGVMSGLMGHQALEKKPLKIEAKGIAETYWLASAAMVPGARMGLASGRLGNVYEYEIVAAGIAAVATGTAPETVPPFSPSAPGGFSAASFSPSAPGGFSAASFSPSDPGEFSGGAFSPTDPGDFSLKGPPQKIYISGILDPAPPLELSYYGLDSFGNHVWVKEISETEGYFLLLFPDGWALIYSLDEVNSGWKSDPPTGAAIADPTLATGWGPVENSDKTPILSTSI